MKKILNHLVLAFMVATQVISFAGCTSQVKVFKCTAECKDSALECTVDVSSTKLDIK